MMGKNPNCSEERPTRTLTLSFADICHTLSSRYVRFVSIDKLFKRGLPRRGTDRLLSLSAENAAAVSTWGR